MSADWKRVLAFGGYAAKTVVYGLLGILIIRAAMGAVGSDTPGQSEVFASLLQQPFGRFLLGAVVLGMICYVLWRLVQAILNIDNLDMSETSDVITRIFYVVSAIIYASGATLAFKTLQGSGSSSGSQNTSEQVSSNLMQNQWGVYLVGAIGIVIIIFAFIQFNHTLKAKFMNKLDRHRMSARVTQVAEYVGRMGFFARGIVYLLVGGFFVNAAWQADPQEAGGLHEALQTILQQSYGQYGLLVVGIGMVTFGIFCAVEARYHKT